MSHAVRFRTPVSGAEGHAGTAGTLEIMHPLELAVHRTQLPLNVIGVRHRRQNAKGLFNRSLGINHHAAIEASRFVHHQLDLSPYSDSAKAQLLCALRRFLVVPLKWLTHG